MDPFDEETRTFHAQRSNWPLALVKASVDEFDYALGLRDGTVLRFRRCVPELEGRWVSLSEVKVVDGPPGMSAFCFERGLEIALDHIAWVTDAPEGS